MLLSEMGVRLALLNPKPYLTPKPKPSTNLMRAGQSGTPMRLGNRVALIFDWLKRLGWPHGEAFAGGLEATI